MMSVSNRLGLTTAEYLKARPPSLGSIQTGLSIFALFVIIRYCVQRTYSWLRPAQRLNSAPYHTNHDLVLPIYRPHYPWPMDEKSSQGRTSPGGMDHQGHNVLNENDGATAIPMDAPWRSAASESMPRHFIPRPPPAPPLTPPELSNAVFAFDERRLSDHESLIHQPNPDYLSSTSTSSFQVDSSADSFIPRRRSYTKTLPMMGAHMRQAPLSTDAGSSEQQTLSTTSAAGSIRLLTANPASEDDMASSAAATNAAAATSHHPKAQRNVDVQGEIVSVLDRDGAGWTRHTRVYGGGACLACAASGGGGFYGATVTPEEMR